MNKLYTLRPARRIFTIAAFLIFSCLAAKAQITITQSDLMQIGNTFTLAVDQTPTVSPGPSGANQTWDLSAIKDTRYDDEVCVAPTATPYASDFTSSVYCLQDTHDLPTATDYYYYTESAGSFSQQGEVLNKIVDNFSPGTTNLTLPLTYQTAWNFTERVAVKEAYVQANYDSAENFFSDTHKNVVDAWGMVTTPAGTYNALRMKFEVQEDYDSLYYHSTSTHQWVFISVTKPAANNVEDFYWVTKGVGVPIAHVTVDSAAGLTTTAASYVQSSNVLGIQEVSNNSKVLVYPNPVSNYLNITASSNNSEQCFVTITDITGREIENTSLANGALQLNTSRYAGGIYLYTVIDREGNLVARGKFCVGR